MDIKEFIKSTPPVGSVSLEIMDGKFKDLDFEEIHGALWRRSQEENDLPLEYFLRRVGILMARHKEADARIHKVIGETPELRNEVGHHILCSWNDDHTFCGCEHPSFTEGEFDLDAMSSLMESLMDDDLDPLGD